MSIIRCLVSDTLGHLIVASNSEMYRRGRRNASLLSPLQNIKVDRNGQFTRELAPRWPAPVTRVGFKES
jgi:hypothetical protein